MPVPGLMAMCIIATELALIPTLGLLCENVSSGQLSFCTRLCATTESIYRKEMEQRADSLSGQNYAFPDGFHLYISEGGTLCTKLNRLGKMFANIWRNKV